MFLVSVSQPILHAIAVLGCFSVLDDVAIVMRLGTALGNVRHDVEVCEEDKHEHHVAGQEILSPGGEVARRRQRIQCVTEGAAELDLKHRHIHT